MTVAHTCKRGAPALTRKRTTYSLKAPLAQRQSENVCTTRWKNSVFLTLLSFFFPPNLSIFLHSPLCLAIVVRSIRSTLRKGGEKIGFAPLRSAIQYGNLFQFYMNLPFCRAPLPPPGVLLPFTSTVLYQELLYIDPSFLSFSISLSVPRRFSLAPFLC